MTGHRTTIRLWIQRSSTLRFSGSNCKMYMYGFDFYGSSAGAFSARDSDIDSVIAAEDCGFFQLFFLVTVTRLKI